MAKGITKNSKLVRMIKSKKMMVVVEEDVASEDKKSHT
jgi:hypothetical protein